MTGFSGIAIFIGAIALLIIIHELGHFLASRLLGVEVEEFGIGFPPRALTLFEWGGTIFSLNWIPLGGFVRPKGENNPDVPGGLAASSPWVRLGVLFAGPAMNFLAAVLLFAFIFLQLGSPVLDQVQIFEIAPNSPAEQAGLQAGDLVLSANDVSVDGTDRLHQTIYDSLGQSIQLSIQRDDEVVDVTLTPRADPPEGEGAIGIVMGNPTVPIGPFNALYMGGYAVVEQSVAILSLPGQLVSGAVSAEEARPVGYKGMYDIYTNVREADAAAETPGAINTLAFFGAISVSLGLLNLLPIPALDGGRILFTLPEIIIRRRIPAAYENMINLVGFALLVMLMIYVNLQDFINPITLP